MFRKLIVAVAGTVPGAFLAVVSRLFSRPLAEWIITRLIIESLEYLASKTKTTVDDEIVAEIRRHLEQAEAEAKGGGGGTESA